MSEGTGCATRQDGVMEPQWVDSEPALDDLVARLRDEPRYGLDTEFHGERSYWPRLALVQIAWTDGVALVDPLAVALAPLASVLEGPGLMIAHAAEQDLAILERACGRGPSRLFDTQTAAGFIGLGTPSLVSLVERLLGARLGKGDRLTDWTRRPLRVEQRVYAAADVEYLLGLHDELTARLEAVGRLDWALDECEERRQRVRTRPEPELAWWRMKGARQLRGQTRGVAQEVNAWRERTAEALDVPPRFVLSDLALAGIVQRPPRTREDLGSIRGLDGRSTKDGTADQLLAAVRSGLTLEPSQLRLPEPDHIDRSLSAAVTVIGAWLTQRAAELDLDPALLGTRADLTALLQGEPSRLASGWRA
jgi:ribonuclease D